MLNGQKADPYNISNEKSPQLRAFLFLVMLGSNGFLRRLLCDRLGGFFR